MMLGQNTLSPNCPYHESWRETLQMPTENQPKPAIPHWQHVAVCFVTLT